MVIPPASSPRELRLPLGLVEAGDMLPFEVHDGYGSPVWLEARNADQMQAMESSLRDWLEVLGKLNPDLLEPGDSWEIHRREFQIPGPNDRNRTVEVRARRWPELEPDRWVGLIVERPDRPLGDPLRGVVHELRNALAVLLTNTQLLRRHGREQPELLDATCINMERRVEHMNRVLRDLSEWSRATRGRSHPAREIQDLKTIVHEASASSRAILAGPRWELIVELPAMPVYVLGDRARLTGAVANMLVEAAQFAPEGSKLHLAVAGTSHEAAVGLRNPNAGIDPEELGRVFEPFFQYARPLYPCQTGLGLAIAKAWVENLGGGITVSSAGKDRGSQFTIHLPRVEASSKAAWLRERGR